MKTLLTIIACAFIALSSTASEIIRGTTLTDGQQLYASDLHSLIDTATIGVQFYNDQQTVPIINGGYYFVALDPANQVFRRVNASIVWASFFGQTNTAIHTPITIVPPFGQIAMFDPTNNWLGSLTVSNLFASASSNINVSAFSFANTNNAGGTNKYVLANYPTVFGGNNAVTGTNMPESLWWGTNGVPYQQSLLTLEQTIAGDNGTNNEVPYYNQWLWSPWAFYGGQTNIYGTNSSGFPAYTNSWGFTTNFPIKSLYLTNSYPASTNTPELVDADSVPINSTQQQTNTTATLGGIYQYLAAKNTLPPYTSARIQFSGYPATITISNDAQTASGLVHVATNSFPTAYGPIYAVSVITNGTQVQVAQFTTNSLLYVVPQPTNNAWLHVYSNYVTAVSGTNWCPVVNSGSGTLNQFLYLTNYTSFNADVIQVITPPTTLRVGIYDVYFRTNTAATPFYYVTGSVLHNSATAPYAQYSGTIGLAIDNVVTTNLFRLETTYGNNVFANYPLVQVLVNPQ